MALAGHLRNKIPTRTRETEPPMQDGSQVVESKQRMWPDWLDSDRQVQYESDARRCTMAVNDVIAQMLSSEARGINWGQCGLNDPRWAGEGGGCRMRGQRIDMVSNVTVMGT